MKRISLFLLTNLSIMLMLSAVVRVFGLEGYLTRAGLNLPALLFFCLVFGFGGSVISLLLSRPIARWTTGARIVTGSEGAWEAWLVEKVKQLSARAGIAMPQVALYEGAANAFATGASRNSSLVAVSTGLLELMGPSQVEAVLAHEISHIQNGDMVTMTLLQGVLNTFVMFLARVIGYVVDTVVFKSEKDEPGVGYVICVLVLELVFGVFASLLVSAFSRHREFRADAGAAKLLGQPNSMISALSALAKHQNGGLPQGVAAFGICGKRTRGLRFDSHPLIAERIEALRPMVNA